jgi:ribosomal-protein-alanine N-acetyltransferase
MPVTSVRLEPPSPEAAQEFVDAVRRSRALHGRWVQAPSTLEQYRHYLQRSRQPSYIGHLLRTPSSELGGAINLSEIVRGGFKSAYLGYYAFEPHHAQGYMYQGVERVLGLAFRKYGLHRVEANIQPDNQRSAALVRGLGFRLEGYSPRYLKIAGRWRDHERWALTVEDWRALQD